MLLIDECHLMWGDLSGYVWGKTDQEITVPVVNQRNKQIRGFLEEVNQGLAIEQWKIRRGTLCS